jgi:hypothetical protein
LSLETCRGGKINTLKKVKKCVKLVENPQLPQDARSREYKIMRDVQIISPCHTDIAKKKKRSHEFYILVCKSVESGIQQEH